MDKFKRTFSFRKKKDHVPESSKPHQWQEDERKVREGTCSFQVRYLGCIEVFESRGIHVCEEAVKALKARSQRSVWKRMSIRKKKKDKDGKTEQSKGKYQRAILYVSGDALRVVDEISKGLIVDQTIEKVSFCAPDRNHEKGFAYICRDGTTRRWMCHGFLAVKESHGDRKANFGERLSHAVGCAFAICLEKKQKREKESVTVTYNAAGTSFTRMGSFRQATLTERMADPQSTIIPEPVPVSVRAEPGGGISNVPLPPTAIERPKASADILQRQASFRGFTKLQESSPFKRQLSLRLGDLPSTLERTNQMNNNNFQNGPGKVSTIPEVSPVKEQGESITNMCAQLSQGLTALSSVDEDPFAPSAQPQAKPTPAQGSSVPSPPVAMLHTLTTVTTVNDTVSSTGVAGNIPATSIPNPWGSPQPTSKVSDAEFWLQSTAAVVSSVERSAAAQPFTAPATNTTATMNGTVQNPTQPPPHSAFATQAAAFPVQAQVHPAVHAPHLQQHFRSHSLDNTQPVGAATQGGWPTQPSPRAPTLSELQQQRGHVAQFQSQPQQQQPQQHGTPVHTTNGAAPAGEPNPWKGEVPPPATNDPFDAAWMSRAPNKPATNPFQDPATSQDSSVTKAFTVNL